MANAPEQLKGIGDLLEANKEGKDIGLDITLLKNQAAVAYNQAEANIKALEEQLKLEKNVLDQDTLDKKHAETIKGLRGELTKIKTALDARLAKLPEERKAKQQATMEKKLRDAVRKTDPKAFEEVLKQQGVDEFKDDVVKDHGLAYYQAMSRMGKGDEAIKAIKEAYDKGGRSYLGITDHYVSDDLLKACAKLEHTDASEYTFLKDLSVRPDRTSYYVATLMTEASKAFSKGSPQIKEYGVYLSKQFNDSDSDLQKGLKKNKAENDKKPDNKFVDAEHQLLVRHLKSPSEWRDAQKSQGNSKPPEVAPTPQPKPEEKTPQPKPAPEVADPNAVVERLKEVEARGAYAKKTQEYATHWDTIFGAGSKVEGLTKDQVAAMPKGIMEIKDNEFVVKTTPEAMKAFTDKMNAAIRNAFTQKMEQYVKRWDLMVDKDAKDPRGMDKAAWEKALTDEKSRTSYNDQYTSDVADRITYLNTQLAKVTPEKLSEKEDAERKDYASKLGAYAERMKICADASSRPESFEPMIKKAENQRAIILDQKDGKYTGTFNPDAVPAYVNERRAEGKNFLISCKDVLDASAKQYTDKVLNEALTAQSAEFNELIAQDFETIDSARLQNAITRYKNQIDNIRTSKGFDTLDKERADAKDPALQDDADEAAARQKAVEKGTPFLNVKQALARGLVVKDPTDPANKVNPAAGYEFVDMSDPKNKAVKAKAKPGEVPPVPAVPKPAPEPAPDGKGKGGGRKGGVKKGPSEGRERVAMTPERALELTGNYLKKHKLDTKAFNELIKSDIGDPKKVKEAFDAIKALQKKLGVKEDGIVGSVTFGKLSEEDKKKLGVPTEKAGEKKDGTAEKKPEAPSEELKKMSEQFEKDKAAMKDLFGEDVVVDFEKILKKYTDFKKPFNEMVTDPEIDELNVRCTRRVLDFMKTAKENGKLDHKLFTLSVIDKEKDIYSMKLKDTPSGFIKRYFNAKHPESTYYFKWENGKFVNIKPEDLPKKEAPNPEPKAPEVKPETTGEKLTPAGIDAFLKSKPKLSPELRDIFDKTVSKYARVIEAQGKGELPFRVPGEGTWEKVFYTAEKKWTNDAAGNESIKNIMEFVYNRLAKDLEKYGSHEERIFMRNFKDELDRALNHTNILSPGGDIYNTAPVMTIGGREYKVKFSSDPKKRYYYQEGEKDVLFDGDRDAFMKDARERWRKEHQNG